MYNDKERSRWSNTLHTIIQEITNDSKNLKDEAFFNIYCTLYIFIHNYNMINRSCGRSEKSRNEHCEIDTQTSMEDSMKDSLKDSVKDSVKDSSKDSILFIYSNVKQRVI